MILVKTMINEPIPESAGSPPDKPWNSQTEEAFMGMTCEEAAQFMGTYMGSYRMMEGSRNDGGLENQIKMVSTLMSIQSKSVFKYNVGGDNPEKAKRMLQVGIAGILFAAYASVVPMATAQLFNLANSAMDMAMEIAAAKGEELKGAAIKFGVRRGTDGNLEIRADLVNAKEAKAKIEASHLGDVINALKAEERIKDGPGNN